MPENSLSEEEFKQSIVDIATILKAPKSAAASRLLDRLVEKYRARNTLQLGKLITTNIAIADVFPRLVEIKFIELACAKSSEIADSTNQLLDGKRPYRMTTLLRSVFRNCFIVAEQGCLVRPDLLWDAAIEDAYKICLKAEKLGDLPKSSFYVLGTNLSQEAVRH